MLQTLLETYAFKVVTASCPREAVAALNAACFDILFTDIRMESDVAGYDVIRAARAFAHPPVVIFYGMPTAGRRRGRISKPARLDVLLQLISDLLQKRTVPARPADLDVVRAQSYNSGHDCCDTKSAPAMKSISANCARTEAES